MKWNDFLNPRSMLTPGVAGSVVMVIANTLWIEFMIPQKWTALLLSFLLIIPILMKYSASWIENVIYFTFNGLIVFALAVNTNFAGRKLQEIAGPQASIAQQVNGTFASNSGPSFIKLNGVKLATGDNVVSIIRSKNKAIEDKEKKKSDEENAQEKIKREKQKKQDREFFDKWF